MHMPRTFLLGLAVAAGLLATACKPDYPSCETDKDCKEKEFCVSRKCQQCRDTTDCPVGTECKEGACARIPGYCRNKSECPAGQECIANRCRACTDDSECPSGSKCLRGTCAPGKACRSDDDCAQDEDCINGLCVAEKKAPPPPTECTLDPVFFDFNESALTTEATSRLAKNVECMKKVGRAVTLVGHADPRGTQEYNLALSERRAQSVRDHMGRLGADGGKMTVLPRGSLDAKGTDEPSWAQDRRVDFTWR